MTCGIQENDVPRSKSSFKKAKGRTQDKIQSCPSLKKAGVRGKAKSSARQVEACKRASKNEEFRLQKVQGVLVTNREPGSGRVVKQ